MPPTFAPKNSYYLLSFRGPIFLFSIFWCCVMCEHPKKDLANGDRFVEPFQDFFLLFLFSTLSNRWTDYCPKQEWAKFGWRSDKTIKNFKNPTLFSRPLRPPCLNMVTSNFFFSQNMMIFFLIIKTLCSIFILFFILATVRKFAKNKNDAIQNVKKRWKDIRSGNQGLGGGYCLYMAKPLVASHYTQWPPPLDWLCNT
jgi:hypothetical protein